MSSEEKALQEYLSTRVAPGSKIAYEWECVAFRKGFRAGRRVCRILVIEEKHGNRYFDASTDDELHRAALNVIKERVRRGWYVRKDVLINGAAAWAFLQEQSGKVEYEAVYTVTLEESS